jgi:hypothetical protein
MQISGGTPQRCAGGRSREGWALPDGLEAPERGEPGENFFWHAQWCAAAARQSLASGPPKVAQIVIWRHGRPTLRALIDFYRLLSPRADCSPVAGRGIGA